MPAVATARKTSVPAPRKARATRNEGKRKPEGQKVFVEAVKKLPDNFLVCRNIMHAWDIEADFRPHEIHTDEDGKTRMRISPLVRQELVCLRCGTKKVDIFFARTMLKLGNSHYKYPDGYKVAGAARGNKQSSVVRLERYRRSKGSA